VLILKDIWITLIDREQPGVCMLESTAQLGMLETHLHASKSNRITDIDSHGIMTCLQNKGTKYNGILRSFRTTSNIFRLPMSN